MPVKIAKIIAREILDSRGNPTVEVEVILDNKIKAKASVASGASTGEFEALEMRDGDEKRYGGNGVLQACENVNKKIAPVLIGQNITAQKKIDALMLKLDGTENKSNLGANAILGVSLACARAAAISQDKPLYKYLAKTYGFEGKFQMPVPMFNILNGGKHADSGLAIQEFMIVPVGIKNIKERIRAGSEIFHNFKKILASGGYGTGVGDEGGFAPRLNSIEEGIDSILKAIEQSGYIAGKDVFISLDAAANSFYFAKDERYVVNPGNVCLDTNQLIALYLEWMKKYPLLSIEDGLDENDWKGWKDMKKRFLGAKKNFVVIADDLTVTNPKRVETAAKNYCANGIIIKLNQIGSLTETVECIQKAQELGWKIIVSHRSGETCDDFIADLAVASGAEFIKTGSLSRGERLAKYNRLMEIENEL
ncbi:MAG: phosphopyruvate hydratase [Candidatus Pacebacteria bacterium]|jgi:enolase|nr:phosphopyruvate hydratase [Candidatus Paceibacterota bacterium]